MYGIRRQYIFLNQKANITQSQAVWSSVLNILSLWVEVFLVCCEVLKTEMQQPGSYFMNIKYCKAYKSQAKYTQKFVYRKQKSLFERNADGLVRDETFLI